MICPHPIQPLRLTYLRDGKVLSFTGCAACVVEWREQNRVVEVVWQNEYLRNVVDAAEAKRLLEKGN